MRRYVSCLPERVLSVLAAKTAGVRGVRNIALVALSEPYERLGKRRLPTPSQVSFTKSVLGSRDPLVKKCLRRGLPRGVFGRLSRPIRCNKCGYFIHDAPCVKCSANRWEETAIRISGRKCSPYSDPKSETKAPPGSPEKVHVIAERISRGESAFHPDDKVCHIPPPLPMRVVSTKYVPTAFMDRFR